MSEMELHAQEEEKKSLNELYLKQGITDHRLDTLEEGKQELSELKNRVGDVERVMENVIEKVEKGLENDASIITQVREYKEKLRSDFWKNVMATILVMLGGMSGMFSIMLFIQDDLKDALSTTKEKVIIIETERKMEKKYKDLIDEARKKIKKGGT